MMYKSMFCVCIFLNIFLNGVGCVSICDQSQCSCVSTLRGSDVTCDCTNQDQKIILKSEEFPENLFSLRVENCGSLSVTGALKSLSLRTITIKGVKDFRVPSQSFLSDLRQLSNILIEDTEIISLPSFSFSSLSQTFDIQFKNSIIGKISSDAFSDVTHLKNLKFIKSKIGDIERHAFGRGSSKIINLILEESEVGTIHERGIWLNDIEIAHIDKCNIDRVSMNGIRLDNAFFIYLTRSSIKNFEAGGITGLYFSGIMIDNDYINPVEANGGEAGPLFDLKDSRQRGSSVAPFFHFTNNVLTRVLPDHAFFISNPTINVAVPNNTLGECSCPDYRDYVRSLRHILDDYTFSIHRALVEHGICLVDKQIFSIGCPNLTPPVFAGPSSKNIRIPSRQLAHDIKNGNRNDKTTTTTKAPNTIAKDLQGTSQRNPTLKPVTQPPTTARETIQNKPTTSPLAKQITTVTPASTTSNLISSTRISTTTVKSLVLSTSNTLEQNNGKTTANIPPTFFAQAVMPTKTSPPITIGQPVIAPQVTSNVDNSPTSLITTLPHPPKKTQTSNLPAQPPPFLGKDIDTSDTQSVWNEIFGGVFAQRLRKPLPDTFPTGTPSVKFGKIMKPLELRWFQKGSIIVIPR